MRESREALERIKAHPRKRSMLAVYRICLTRKKGAYLSASVIADEACLTPRAVQYALVALVEVGVLSRVVVNPRRVE